MINTVIFDVGGVLANYHAEDYFIQLGYSKEKADQLRKATQQHASWKEYDRGVLSDEEVRARF